MFSGIGAPVLSTDASISWRGSHSQYAANLHSLGVLSRKDLDPRIFELKLWLCYLPCVASLVAIL